MHSPERRKHRRRLLLHLNRRKVEAFIHSVIYFRWPLCLPQLGTSVFDVFAEFGVIRTFGLNVCNAGVERGPNKIFGVSGVQGLF